MKRRSSSLDLSDQQSLDNKSTAKCRREYVYIYICVCACVCVCMYATAASAPTNWHIIHYKSVILHTQREIVGSAQGGTAQLFKTEPADTPSSHWH
jgi:hypothetical protein